MDVAWPVLPTRPVRPILKKSEFKIIKYKYIKNIKYKNIYIRIKKTVPVDILLDLPGHVVVDDVRDVLDVQAARHHVGGHQDLLGAVPELGQRQLSLGLGPVAEDAGGRKTLPDKDLALLTFLL